MDYISLQERIAHLQKMFYQMLQGKVVDLEYNYQALQVEKTQVECERDELQKKYSEAVKRVGDMEKVTEKYMMIEIINMVQTFKKVDPDTKQ